MTAPRRSQVERSIDTQLRLCQAAVELITEVGYERLTVAQISERAGVSKGAQAHHYPTKEDMLVAAFGHLLRDWQAKREGFVATHGPNANVQELMGYMWRDIFGRAEYLASLELMLAANHYPTLRERIREALTHWITERNEVFQRVVPMLDSDRLAVFMEMNFCLLRGMAVNQSLSLDSTLNQKILDMWIQIASDFVKSEPHQVLPSAVREKKTPSKKRKAA